MNLPLDRRMDDTINRIQERAKKQKVAVPPPMRLVAPSKIPKTAAYWLDLVKKAQAQHKPFLVRVYKKCAELAVEKKYKQVNMWLTIAKQELERNPPPARVAQVAPVAPAPVAPAPVARPRVKHQHNLRSVGRPLQEIYTPKTLKNFIVDYTQKVKHKKEILYQFLRGEYEANRKYVPSSYKFAKIKPRNRNRA